MWIRVTISDWNQQEGENQVGSMWVLIGIGIGKNWGLWKKAFRQREKQKQKPRGKKQHDVLEDGNCYHASFTWHMR